MKKNPLRPLCLCGEKDFKKAYWKKMDENYLKTLRILELEPSLSQRVLARRLNLSLGKANSLLKAMIDEGYVRVVRFKNASRKRAYRYDVTQEGIQFKWDLACRFFQVKAQECEKLQKEIEVLKQEINKNLPALTQQFRSL